MRVLLGLLVWSLAEISAFVVVGGWIGVMGVLVLVLGSGVAGVAILRRQGLALERLRGGRAGLAGAGDAGLLALASVLLILPGLLTDVLGLALLVPGVRRWVVGFARRRMVVVSETGLGEVIEARAVEVAANAPREPSGWTRP